MIRALKVALAVFVLWLPASLALSSFLVVDKIVERPNAIVILGGSAEYIERTSLAASLFREGLSDRIILTNDGQRGGWDSHEKRNPYFVESARSNLIASGVPPAAIMTVPEVVTDGTDEEAAAVLEFSARQGFTSILLVTSPYHSRRALWIFETYRDRLRVDCAIGITSSRGGHLDPAAYLWWTSVEGWMLVVPEYSKLMYFWLLKSPLDLVF